MWRACIPGDRRPFQRSWWYMRCFMLCCWCTQQQPLYATTTHASYGLALLKPSTLVDTQRMHANGVRATQTTRYVLKIRATEGHYANPLPFKATVVSETKAHDPPPRAKASQMLLPYSSLLSSPVNCVPPALDKAGGAITTLVV